MFEKQDVLIFGASKAGEEILEYIRGKYNSIYKVVGCLDNDRHKWGNSICGIKIFSPESLKQYDNNIMIFIASSYYEEIAVQLGSMGYSKYLSLQDKYFGFALDEFINKTKKMVYAKILKIDTGWFDFYDKEIIEQSETIAEKSLKLYQLMTQEKIKSEYQPGYLWSNAINRGICDLYGALRRNDFERFHNLIFEFRQYAAILGIAADDALDILDPSLVEKKYVLDIVSLYLILERILDPRIVSNIDESIVGSPLFINYKQRKLTMECLRHAFYVQRISDIINKLDIPQMNKQVFIELGGGVGDTARQMVKYFGNKMVYVILDLPEVLSISTYYIMRNFFDLKIGTYSDFNDQPVIKRSDLEKYNIVLLPNHFIEKLENYCADIFFNTASLGEMERNIFENYIRQIERVCKYLFYSHNRDQMELQRDGRFTNVGIDDFSLNQNDWEVVSNNTDVGFGQFKSLREKIFRRKQ